MSAGVLCVYAVADSPPPPGAHGLFGAPLGAVSAEPRLQAIFSEHERAPEPGEDVLWAHEQIVEALMGSATILPMRFGSTAADQGTLLAVLEERREEFIASLERVRGAVELSVRARLPVPSEPAAAAPAETASSGRVYLLERARARRLQLDGAERIDRPLAALAREALLQPAGADPAAFKAAYLVDRERVDAFAAKVMELNDGFEDEPISCTGPWPPYSFAAENDHG